MIPAIIFYLLKKLRSARKRRAIKHPDVVSLKSALLIVLASTSAVASAQQHVQRYSILYKGEKVGSMQVVQTTNADSVKYRTVSDVKMRMIFRIHVATTEESVFVQEKLVSSSVLRNVNGSARVNRQLLSSNNRYQMYNDGKKKEGSVEAIEYNFGRLYSLEPVGRKKVWSDAYHEYLNIQDLGGHKYKVTLPDGDYNYYYYHNGICNKVEIVHSFYTIHMVLN